MEIIWIKPDGASGATLRTLGEVADLLAGEEGFLWVLLDHDDPEAPTTLATLFAAREEDVNACRVRSPMPRCHFYDGHAFIAMNGLVRGDDGRLHFQPIGTFYGDRRFATVLGPTDTAVSPASEGLEIAALRNRLLSGEFRPASLFEFVPEVRERVLLSHEHLVESLAGEMARLEAIALTCNPVRSDWLIQELFKVRHDLQVIRTNAAQNQELYARIAEGAAVADPANQARLTRVRQAFQHVRNTADLEGDYLQELLDLFETRVSTELNRFVRQLTAWGAIGLAGTLIAGIYGMNFAHMPELDWRYGYPMALGVIVLVGIALAVIFRRRGWL